MVRSWLKTKEALDLVHFALGYPAFAPWRTTILTWGSQQEGFILEGQCVEDLGGWVCGAFCQKPARGSHTLTAIRLPLTSRPYFTVLHGSA